MGIEAKKAEQRNIDLFVDLTTADNGYVLDPRQRKIRCNSAGGTFNVFLPPVAECFGLRFCFRNVDPIPSVNVVNIKSQGDDEKFNVPALPLIYIMGAEGACVFYSDGRGWIGLFNP